MKPIEIKGLWDEGYCMDYHSISSEYVGDDPYGNARFQTERTVLGQFMYELKYKGNTLCIDKMIDLIGPFLKKWLQSKNIDVVLPVPPSKLDRYYQPVFGVSKAIADYLNVAYTSDVLYKNSRQQYKDINAKEKYDIENSIVLMKSAKREYNALIVDDIFETGKTLNQVVEALKRDPLLKKVYVVAITKRR
jgi:pli0014 protein